MFAMLEQQQFSLILDCSIKPVLFNQYLEKVANIQATNCSQLVQMFPPPSLVRVRDCLLEPIGTRLSRCLPEVRTNFKFKCDHQTNGLQLLSSLTDALSSLVLSCPDCSHQECLLSPVKQQSNLLQPSMFVIPVTGVNLNSSTFKHLGDADVNLNGAVYRLQCAFVESKTNHVSVEVRTPGGFFPFPSSDHGSNGFTLKVHELIDDPYDPEEKLRVFPSPFSTASNTRSYDTDSCVFLAFLRLLP
jgi:hypothetical protein